MIHYLIDFENVHEDGLSLIQEEQSKAKNQDVRIYIFGSNRTPKINFTYLTISNALFSFFEVKNGEKNGLDIFLGTKLGMLVKEHPSDSFLIVSKDKGYDAMVSLLYKEGVQIMRIFPPEAKKEAVSLSQNSSAIDNIISKLKGVSSETKTEIRQKLENGDKTIYQSINKEFKKPKKASEIYEPIKSMVKEFFKKKTN